MLRRALPWRSLPRRGLSSAIAAQLPRIGSDVSPDDVAAFAADGAIVLRNVLPPAWVDHHLPVELSVPADLTRVMVGRIELVTARQRELLAAVAAGPTSDSRWFYEQFGPAGGGDSDEFWELWSKITSGRASLLDADLELPPDYRAYVELGRFRDALVLDELARRPTEGLRAFVGSYGIQP